MRERIRKWLPTPDTLRGYRWLRWIGPVLYHPRLWHFSRRGVALGVALGIFFGLLIPIAQIPVSAALAVAVRANVPMAVASTLVTNPLTFGPVYYGAYRLGKVVLGDRTISESEAEQVLSETIEEPEEVQQRGAVQRLAHWLERLRTIGKPLATGLAIIASLSGLTAYFLITALWGLHIRRTRRKRFRQRMEDAPRPARR